MQIACMTASDLLVFPIFYCTLLIHTCTSRPRNQSACLLVGCRPRPHATRCRIARAPRPDSSPASYGDATRVRTCSLGRLRFHWPSCLRVPFALVCSTRPRRSQCRNPRTGTWTSGCALGNGRSQRVKARFRPREDRARISTRRG